MSDGRAETQAGRSLLSLFWTFFKIGAFTFGGGLAMVPLIRRELVSSHGWLRDDEFLDVIGVAQCSPGPVAVNIAVFAGLKVMGYPGAILATLGVVIPSVITISVIAAFFLSFRAVWWMEMLFRGIRAAVVALIANAAYRLGRAVIGDRTSLVFMLAALFGSVALRMHPVLLIVLGGVSGAAIRYEAACLAPSPRAGADTSDSPGEDEIVHASRRTGGGEPR